eukprot:6184216-Pleurochrysis_carterae.AAC.1
MHVDTRRPRTVHAAMMPTSVLPAPHGSTMMPERARWLPNMRESELDCPQQKSTVLNGRFETDVQRSAHETGERCEAHAHANQRL